MRIESSIVTIKRVIGLYSRFISFLLASYYLSFLTYTSGGALVCNLLHQPPRLRPPLILLQSAVNIYIALNLPLFTPVMPYSLNFTDPFYELDDGGRTRYYGTAGTWMTDCSIRSVDYSLCGFLNGINTYGTGGLVCTLHGRDRRVTYKHGVWGCLYLLFSYNCSRRVRISVRARCFPAP